MSNPLSVNRESLAEHLRFIATLAENADTPSKMLNVLLSLTTALEFTRLQAYQKQMDVLNSMQHDLDPREGILQ